MKSFLRFLEFRTEYFRAVLRKFRPDDLYSDKGTGNLHILVMGKKDYARMGIFSLITFERHHKNFHFIIHCDFASHSYMSKYSWLLPKSVTYCVCILDSQDPYRTQLEIFSLIQGTRDILADVDIWWRGPLRNLSGPLTYNTETFKRSDELMALGRKLLKSRLELDDAATPMITGCVTYWGGQFSKFHKNEILSSYDYLRNHHYFILSTNETEWQLTGQIIMSLVFSSLDNYESVVAHEVSQQSVILESSWYRTSRKRY